MPKIMIMRGHPPTSIEGFPEGVSSVSEIILLPGIPKKVTEEEMAFIRDKYSYLKLKVIPTGCPKEKVEVEYKILAKVSGPVVAEKEQELEPEKKSSKKSKKDFYSTGE